MIKTTLSWLLHHANRYHKSEVFYTIKDRILTEHGSVIGYDFQHIEGKKCHTCNGSGIWIGYSWHTGRQYRDFCNRCGGCGWYINPHYNILKRISFGKYIFHKPFDRTYKKPEPGSVIIEGYVNHEPSHYSYLARMILYILYDIHGYRKRWRFEWGGGWYSYKQYKPKHLFNNIVHLLKHGRKAIPFYRFKRCKVMNLPHPTIEYDDLPF